LTLAPDVKLITPFGATTVALGSMMSVNVPVIDCSNQHRLDRLM